ncbi:hypothetical protein NP493_1504g00001 [Ridgeia piscesae]|uniref:Uncharacterized protein n=1 Tax=Ridgeia piscesae TaxID=27915 RepID=A0AAD9K0A9_RIDPI|nr:hypothetical protein NP493_1504g00001 [Ridgeia piscesae]
MPKARKSSSVTDSNVCDTDVMLLRFLELLSDDQVVRKLKSTLYPQALSDKLDTQIQTIAGLTSQLEGKECRITVLEEQVELLQSECDNQEQYSRRCNLRIHGIPETGDGEDTTLKVLDLVNAKMAVTPPVAKEDIVVSHRLGKQRDTGDRPRAVIVVFSKITVRNDVIRARRRLRNTRDQHQVFVNEDLTQRRAALAAATRQLKRNQKIADCWTYNAKIVIKTLANAIKIISTQAELNTFQ